MELDKLVNAYNFQYANINQNTLTDALLNNCNPMLSPEPKYLDAVFNQKTPYSFPPLIICEDSKRNGFNDNILLFNLDVIKDNCGNTFNLRNQKNATGLQTGYARNIDLESELHRINHYQDKCYYNNYKIDPKSNLEQNNGLKCNASVIVKDYAPVGQNNDCVGNCVASQPCHNTPPTDLGCESDIHQRYDFSHNKFTGKTCIVKGDRKYFPKVSSPPAKDIVFQSTPRNKTFMSALNSNELKHDYYKFGEEAGNNPCTNFPPQRLFHNCTKRSTLPNFHNMVDISPKYLA